MSLSSKHPISFARNTEISATNLLLITLSSIIIVETVIMTVFIKLSIFITPLTEIVLDCLLLALFLFPILYKLVFIPLVQRIREREEAENALRESEAKYRDVIDTIRDVIFHTDPSGVWVFLNPAWSEITGLTIEEAIGSNFIDYVHPDDRDQALLGFRNYILQQDIWRQQVRFLSKTDVYRWVEIDARPVNDFAGVLKGITGTIRDINDSRLASDALERRDVILQNISLSAELFMREQELEVSIAMVLERIGSSNNFRFAFIAESQYCEDGSMALASTHKWCQNGLLDFPEQLKTIHLENNFLKRWRLLLENRDTVSGRVDTFPADEADFLRRHGIAWIALVPIFVGSELWGAVGFERGEGGADISSSENDALKLLANLLGSAFERKRVNYQLALSSLKLKERKNFIESVITNMLSGIVVTDIYYRIVLANRYAEETIFSGCNEIIGKFLSDICRAVHNAIFHGADKGEVQLANGTYIGYKRSALKDADGFLSGYIITFVDITEIIKIRNKMHMSERLATMGEVVARVAHEMRNPLFGITAASQILAMEIQLTPPQKELMKSLLSEAKRLNTLVEDLLDSSKEIKLKIKPVELTKIINESIGFNEVFLLEKRLTVEKYLPDHEIHCNADPERLKQVLLNIFKNSIDASPFGGVIKFLVELSEADVTISVIDSGKGIPREIMDNIFDLFFTTKKSGTGLGLYICKRLIDAHGGSLFFVNNDSGGATFTVTLPIAWCDQ